MARKLNVEVITSYTCLITSKREGVHFQSLDIVTLQLVYFDFNLSMGNVQTVIPIKFVNIKMFRLHSDSGEKFDLF